MEAVMRILKRINFVFLMIAMVLLATGLEALGQQKLQSTTPLANIHVSQSLGKTQTQTKHDFAFTIDCDWPDRPDHEPNICLLGEYKRGIAVTLLEVGQPRTCLSQTKDAIDYKDEVGDELYQFTPISPVAQCRAVHHYSIAVLGSRISSYQIIKMERITDKKKVQSLDKLVRNKNVLEKLRTRAGDAWGYRLSKDLPIVYRYPIPKMETFIVAYKTLQGYKREPDLPPGPRAIIINNIAYPLTGWCSYPYIRILPG
jgi:hypothetical protein